LTTRRFVVTDSNNVVVSDRTISATDEDWAVAVFEPNTFEIDVNANDGKSLSQHIRHPGNVFTPPGQIKRLSPVEFMERFTDQEFAVLEAARAMSPAVSRWFYRFERATYIDLEDPRVTAGLDALIQNGLLAPERKAVIMAWP
jgi:hypothetical protein